CSASCRRTGGPIPTWSRRWKSNLKHRRWRVQAIRDAIQLLSTFVIVAVIVGFPLYGVFKRVPVYEAFVEGAKEGFTLVTRIIPYLVGILFAMSMFRASGAMDFLIELLRPVLNVVRI